MGCSRMHQVLRPSGWAFQLDSGQRTVELRTEWVVGSGRHWSVAFLDSEEGSETFYPGWGYFHRAGKQPLPHSLPHPRFSSISFTSTPRNLWHSHRGLRGTETMQESGEASHCLARFLFLRLAPQNIIARLKADCMSAKWLTLSHKR